MAVSVEGCHDCGFPFLIHRKHHRAGETQKKKEVMFRG